MKFTAALFSLLFLACSSSAPVTKTAKKQLDKETQLEYENKAIQYYTRGSLLMNNNEHSKALNELYQALLYDENSVEIYTGIATCLINLNRIETAEINLQKAKRLDSLNTNTLLMLGSVQTRLKSHPKALKNYLKVNTLEPQNIKAFEMICFLYSFNKEDKKLLKFISERVQFIDPPADLAYSIATYYYNAKDFNNAQHWVTQSLQLKTDYESAKLLQSQLNLQSGKKEDALASLQELYKSNPDDNRLLFRIVQILRDDNKFNEILNLLKNKPDLDEQFLLLKGEAFYKIEDFNSAQQIFADMSLKSFNPYFQFIAADTELKLGNYETAHAYFSDIISIAPKEPQGYYGAGYALIQQELYQEAEAVLRKGLVRAKNNSTLYSLLSQTLYELDRLSEANDYIENMLRDNPNDFQSLTEAAGFYQRANRFKESDALYEKALLIDAENPLLLNNFSYSLSKRGIQLDRALTMIKKALVKEPNNSFYLDTIGWIYYKQKNYKLAKAFVERSLELRSDSKESAVVFDHLGDIYFALGNVEKAIESWQQAAKIDPTLSEVQKKLDRHKK